METSEDGLKIRLAESSIVHSHPGLDQLRPDGHQIHQAQNGSEVLSAIDCVAHDMVLMNLDQPAIGTTEINAATQKLDSNRAPGPRGHIAPERQSWPDCLEELGDVDRLAETDLQLSKKAPGKASAPVIPLSAALDCTAGHVELLQSLIELCFEQQPGLIRQIHEDVAQSNPELLERGAHSLKGCVSVFAAADTCQAAFILETVGRGSNWSEANAALANLDQQLARCEPALRPLDAAIGRGEIFRPLISALYSPT